ncbi:MAG: FlgD immunoglobulin-like domain containing protein [Candidatus Neomarinimicrobiota bacterium]
MKKTLFVFVCLALTGPSEVFADTTDVAASTTTDPFTLNAAHAAGTAGTVYRLARDSQYLMNATIIDSSSEGLRIIGAAGTGNLPIIQPAAAADGSLPSVFFKTTGTTILKDLAFNGNGSGKIGRVGSVFEGNGKDQRVVVDGCVVEGLSGRGWGGGEMLASTSSGMRFHVLNSIFRGINGGDVFTGGVLRGAAGGGMSYDTLVVQNSSYFGSSSYLWVGPNPSGYALIDHNTVANILANPFFTPGMANTTITNNIFYNTQIYGQNVDENKGGWFGEDSARVAGGNYHGTISFDTLSSAWNDSGYAEDSRNINVSNNVYYDDATVVAHRTRAVEVTVSNAAGDGDSTYTDQRLDVPWMNAEVTAMFANNTSLTAENNHNIDPGFIHTYHINNVRDEMIAHATDYQEDRAVSGTVYWLSDADGNNAEAYSNMTLPVIEDFSYTNVSAATASTSGGPVGDPRWGAAAIDDPNDFLPKAISLEQNYPNPFNPSTEITYSLNTDSHVKLTIYNMVGQKVSVLENKVQSAGSHKIRWNGTDLSGKAVSSGVYLYTLENAEMTITKKMILMR